MRQHLPARRQLHQPGRTRRAADQVRRRHLDHRRNHPGPRHHRRLRGRHGARHRQHRSQPAVSQSRYHRLRGLHAQRRRHHQQLRHQHLAHPEPGQSVHPAGGFEPRLTHLAGSQHLHHAGRAQLRRAAQRRAPGAQAGAAYRRGPPSTPLPPPPPRVPTHSSRMARPTATSPPSRPAPRPSQTPSPSASPPSTAS